MSVRGALLDENVKDAAVDYDAKLAYLIPGEGYTVEEAIEAVGRSGKYRAKLRP